MRKRPLLNYFGGKWRIAPKIIEHFGKHDIFIEPFGGSASILLRKPRSKREILNDLDSEIFNLYLVARDAGEELKNKIRLTPHSRQEYLLSMQKSDCKIESARRTIVRCYFGIGDSFLKIHNAFRTSKTSNTSVSQSWKNYHDAFDFIIERLAGVTIENLSYERLIEKYDSKDSLFYFDPPYPKSTRSKNHGYKHDWTEFEHLSFLGKIKNIKGSAVVSTYENEMYSEDLKDWEKISIASVCNNAVRREEILFIKK